MNQTSPTSSINHDKLFQMARVLYGCIFLVGIIVIGMLTWPLNPLEYTNVTLDSDTVIAGEPFAFKVYMIKHTEKIGTMTRYLECKETSTITLTNGLADSKPGDTFKHPKVIIPRIIDNDVCKIKWIVRFEYFGFREKVVKNETPEFRVVKDASKPIKEVVNDIAKITKANKEKVEKIEKTTAATGIKTSVIEKEQERRRNSEQSPKPKGWRSPYGEIR
jgi:hypothetical protein